MPSNSSDALYEVNITKNNAIEDFANRSAQLKSQINEAVSNLKEYLIVIHFTCCDLHSVICYIMVLELAQSSNN